jgi:KipI family sensor histidine kinase inhibitor
VSLRFLPLGEAALTVELGDRISPAINASVHALHADLTANPLPGLIECVPAYRSLTLHYNPLTLSLDELSHSVTERTAHLDESGVDSHQRLHVIPVTYGSEFGPDLEAVAQEVGLTPEQVIAEHSQATYRVYMLGFSPGFPYLGRTSARLDVARLPTPRTRVPAGSVAIAGRQTGIYPSSTPGGWRLLGRTGWRFFDPQRMPPARLQPGDLARFRPASPSEAGLSDESAPDWGTLAISGRVEGHPIIEVLESGLLTTVQDGGRFGFQSVGVPVSGAMDRAAMRAANQLVGNASDAPVVEITLAGPQLRFLDDALIAVTGADLSLWVEWPDGNRLELPGWMAIYLRRGSRLGFAGRRSGCRAYLAISGGMRVPLVLNSASTCLAGGFGGYAGRRLQSGDFLQAQPLTGDISLRAGQGWPSHLRPGYSNHPVVRILPGPHWRQFTRVAQAAFLSSEYEAQSASDRVGVRLKGPTLRRRISTEVISSGVTTGSVQIPADGQPIVLGADRQTVGGYPQMAVVIGPDLPLLAQLVPGDRVSFRRVTLEEAINIKTFEV